MEHTLGHVAKLLRPVPDFPKPGILFWDIEPVLRDTQAMPGIISAFVDYWIDTDIDVIAGFDARGFIFGTALALQMGLPFTQIRKKGKLPGATISQTYELEYGTATVEMIDDGFITGKRVLLVDDLLATGGTALAGAMLVERLGGTVAGFACVTEIPTLGGRGRLLAYPVQSLISIIGDQAEWDVEYCVDMYITTPDQQLVFINRLSEPLGYAMPGGRIERVESVAVAALREATEELNCHIEDLVYLATLAEPGRDPRGHKVSIVVKATTTTSDFEGEQGKTEAVCSSLSDLPPPEQFAFDHGHFVHGQIAM